MTWVDPSGDGGPDDPPRGTLEARPPGIEVLLFGRLREAIGGRRLELPVPDPPTPSGLWRMVAAAAPSLSDQRRFVRPAVNERFATWDTPVCAGDRVAFLPPMSGG